MQIAIGIYNALPLTNENQHNHHHHHHHHCHHQLFHALHFFLIQPSPPIIATATMLFSPLWNCGVVTVLFAFFVIMLFICHSRPPHSPGQFIEYRNDKALSHTLTKNIVLIQRTEKKYWCL